MTDSFKTQQKQFARVKTAYQEKEKLVKELFTAKGMELGDPIFIRAFKSEAKLEVWAKGSGKSTYELIKTYDICASSGELGPKRKQGDGQVPEGFYSIDRFNPASNFYLSLGVSYPNKSDKINGKGNLGGDIFIHGNCVTIGCMPLTDDKIMEVYIMAVEAKSEGQQNIPVHIFPCKLDDPQMASLEKEHLKEPQLITFWKNLQTGYKHFKDSHSLPTVTVLENGEYSFK